MKRVVLLPLIVAAVAQVFAQPQTLKVGVNLVNVLFTVTDHKGHLVPGLTQNDFLVEEDGKKQDVQFFSHENQLPLTLGLLIDVSPSVKPTFDQERAAASRFLRQVLRPKDLAMLIEFEKSVTLAQDFTDDLDLLQGAIDGLEIGPGIDGGTSLYDALYLSAKQLKEESGRKAIILISDGDDTTSKLKLNEAMVAIHNADCVIYSIAIGGSRIGFNAPRALGGAGGYGVMKKFSEETGGSFFRVDDQREFESAFAQINQELRNQYSIGYVSSNRLNDGKYRRIKIVPRDPTYRIQARKGYYAANNSGSQ
jgi:VWFA-related protein